jgi:hypothetical protein
MLKFSQSLGLSKPQSKGVSELFAEEFSLRKLLLKSLSSYPLGSGGREDNNGHVGKLIPCDGNASMNNVLCVVCLKFQGASEEEEPLLAAGFLARTCRESNPLPYASEDSDISFCRKTLTALSLFLPAMIRRLEKHGAPAPHFYRKMAQAILSDKTKAHRALAAHHQAWEDFLFEQLVVSRS